MMVPINATLISSDDVQGVESVVLTSITSNQPDSGNGDIQAHFGTAATSFSLRAEKGRIYTHHVYSIPIKRQQNGSNCNGNSAA